MSLSQILGFQFSTAIRLRSILKHHSKEFRCLYCKRERIEELKILLDDGLIVKEWVQNNEVLKYHKQDYECEVKKHESDQYYLKFICYKCEQRNLAHMLPLIHIKSLILLLNKLILEESQQQKLILAMTALEALELKNLQKKKDRKFNIEGIKIKIIHDLFGSCHAFTKSVTCNSSISSNKISKTICENCKIKNSQQINYSKYEESPIVKFTQCIKDSRFAELYEYYHTTSQVAGLSETKQYLNALGLFSEEQYEFKVSILKYMGLLLKKFKSQEMLELCVNKSLKGFCNRWEAFHMNDQIYKHVLFDINRKTIQYKEVYIDKHAEEYSPKIQQIVRMEVPFHGTPLDFKIATFGFVDYVDIGLFFQDKQKYHYRQINSPYSQSQSQSKLKRYHQINTKEDQFALNNSQSKKSIDQEQHQPIMIRIKIKPENYQIIKCQNRKSLEERRRVLEEQRQHQKKLQKQSTTEMHITLNYQLQSVKRTMKVVQTSQESSSDEDSLQSVQTQICPYSIIENEVISIDVNKQESKVTFKNKTQDQVLQVYELDPSIFGKFYVYACVGLVGVKVLVENVTVYS